MTYIFNPFTGNFDAVNDLGALFASNGPVTVNIGAGVVTVITTPIVLTASSTRRILEIDLAIYSHATPQASAGDLIAFEVARCSDNSYSLRNLGLGGLPSTGALPLTAVYTLDSGLVLTVSVLSGADAHKMILAVTSTATQWFVNTKIWASVQEALP